MHKLFAVTSVSSAMQKLYRLSNADIFLKSVVISALLNKLVLKLKNRCLKPFALCAFVLSYLLKSHVWFYTL